MNRIQFRKLILQLCCGVFLFSSFFTLEACGPAKDPDACEKNSDCTAKYDQTYRCDKAKNKCVKKKSTVAECQTDDDCIGSEICQSGSCVSGGGNNGGNGNNGTTEGGPGDGGNNGGGDPGTGTQEPDPCSCPSGTFCKLDTNECVACLEDSHCGGDPNACSTDCTAKSKQCVQNKCEETACECPLGQKCNPTSKVCESGQVCPDGSKPDASGNCPKACASTKCQPNESPDPKNNCTCVAHKGWCQACTSDSECGPQGRCVSDNAGNKFCAEDCTQSSSCSDSVTYSCLNLGQYKVCMPTSGSCPCLGVQCSAGQQCCKHDGACHECCGKGDCQAPKVCHNVTFTCVEDKCSGVQCPAGSACNPNTGKCGCPANCPQGQCCDQATGQCSASACGGTSGCAPACTGGQVCCDLGGQKQCLPSCPTGGAGQCQTDADCGGGGKICCNLAGMGKMCMDGSNPMMRLLCGGGGSSGGCKTDADCSAGQKCCKGLGGILPSSCKAKCGGFP